MNLFNDILIVDDTLPNLRALSKMLTQAGYEVRGAQNGRTALMIIDTKPPDLILLDINMPEMSGYEVCQRLRANEKSKHIPVIFISALDELSNKVKAFEVGGTDYITKPFRVEEVLARVQTHLSLHTLQVQLGIANQHLSDANNELEIKVAQRTAELVKTNQQLQAEIKERQKTEAAMYHTQKLESLGILSLFNFRL